MEGWIKLHRKISENDLWEMEPFTKGQAWIDLILNANYKDRIIWISGQQITVKRGQIAWSELTMSKRWQWSRDKVRRFLKMLKTRQQIIQDNAIVTSLITVLNYDVYQSDNTPDDTTNDTPDNTPVDTAEKQPTIHKQEYSNKEKKDNNDNKIQGDSFNSLLKKSDKQIQKLEAKFDIVYPFVTDRFVNAWSLWLDHRKALKKPYRSALSQQTALKKLSEFDEDTAIKIINQSIENDWQGLFPLKDQNNGTTKTKQQRNTNDLAAGFAARYGSNADK